MPEERRLVTLLFVDIVGSTSIASEHDAEVVRSSLDAAFEKIQHAIERHGGIVEKFIGDAVMAAFGVPRAHDDDAERAVRAAFEVRESVSRLRGPFPLEVRIGLTSGEAVTRSDGGDQRLATGIAVILAQRLQAAAAPGEILVGDLTHRLTESAVLFSGSRSIEAKGIGRMTAWVAEALVSSIPHGGVRREGLRAPLVGRDAELTRLRDLFGALGERPRPLLVTVLGPAGSGKTRLAEEFLSSIEASRILRGRCLPYGEGVAAFPVEQMLRTDAEIELSDSREEAERKLRERVAQVVDGADDLDAVQRRILALSGVTPAAEAMPDVAVTEATDELRWAFRRYVERRALEKPAVLLFEDIQWAAPPVLDLIEHVAEWARAPLFLLCLARPDLLEARPSWPSSRSDARTIELGPLDASATGDLVAALLAPEPPSGAVQAEVFARSEGNPLYVEVFVRDLVETGLIVREGGTWMTRSVVRPNVPETLQGLIAARLDRISPGAKRILQEAAVIGRTFSSSALAHLHKGAVSDELHEADASDLIEEAEASTHERGALHRFRHVLFRDVAYGMLPKSDRAVLHDRYRQWSEDAAGERKDELIEIIADHAEQAFNLATEIRSTDLVRLARLAFDRLRTAADRARDRGDLRTSLQLATRAKTIGHVLAITEDERVALEAAILLVRTSLEHGDAVWSDVEDLLTRARQIPPSEPFVRLLIAFGGHTYSVSVEDSARSMREAHRAARSLGDHELITHALLSMPVVARAAGDLEELGRMREEALAYAKAHGVTREMPECLRTLASLSLWTGRSTRAASLLDEAERAARASGSKTARFAALSSRAEVAIWTGPWDQAVAYARQLEPLANALGTKEASVSALLTLGRALFEAGDLQGARSAHNAALGMAEAGSFELVDSVFNLVMTLTAVGELREARRLFEVCARVDLPWQNFHAMNAVIAGVLLAAEGDATAAEASFRRGIAIFEDATITPNRLHWAEQLYAELLLREGRLAEARALLEKVHAFYSDPLAAPRRARIEALLARTQGVMAG